MSSCKLQVTFLIMLHPIITLCSDPAVTVSPSNPRIGDTLTIAYNPSSRAATIRGVKRISVEIMQLEGTERKGIFAAVPLNRTGSVWSGRFHLENEKAVLLLFRFTSGRIKDDNGSNVWSVLVHGAHGVPVPNAHLTRSLLFWGPGILEFKHERDSLAAMKEIAEEEAVHSDNLNVVFYRWNQLVLKSAGDSSYQSLIRDDLDSIYALKKDDEGAVASLLYWFERIGWKRRAEVIRADFAARYPAGKVAMQTAEDRVFSESDPRRRIELMKSLNRKFPVTGLSIEPRLNLLQIAYLELGEYDSAAAIADSMPTPRGAPYNAVAEAMLRNGVNLERAAQYALKGISILRRRGTIGKNPISSDDQWVQLKMRGLASILDTYGCLLMKLARTKEADVALEESYRLTEGSQGIVTQHLIQNKIILGKYSQAFALARKAIASGLENEGILEYYHFLFLKLKRSSRSYSKSISRLESIAVQRSNSELKKQLLERRPRDAAFKLMDGQELRLTQFLGRVVVLEFWSMWCGPCKTSLPYLQRVFDSFERNDSVRIFAVDCYEHEPLAQVVPILRDFLVNHNYTFPVILDDGWAHRNNVEVVPTTIIIDRDGMLCFRQEGAEGEELVQHVSSRVRFLLNNGRHLDHSTKWTPER